MREEVHEFLAWFSVENPVGFKNLQDLRKVGGSKKFHQEGDAYIHTLLVVEKGLPLTPEGWTEMEWGTVLLLHDIGKIYTAVEREKDEWSYPNHSTVGGDKLSEFISEDTSKFRSIKWLITNHIKPLFWKDKSDAVSLMDNDIPEGVDISVLSRLALADLEGSYGEVDNSKIKNLLRSLI